MEATLYPSDYLSSDKPRADAAEAYYESWRPELTLIIFINESNRASRSFLIWNLGGASVQTGLRKARIIHFTLCDYVDAKEYISSGRRPLKENNGELKGWGYHPDMRDDEAFALNCWDWSLRIERDPKFVIFSWCGIVRFASEITEIVPIPASPRKLKRIRGNILGGSNSVYQEYVNHPTPEWAKGYNPRYLYE